MQESELELGRYGEYLLKSLVVSEKHARYYVAWVKEHVAASTQNQAFGAPLFMCREVLRIDLGDLSQSVRAKRGHRRTVVLSVAEVKAVLSRMKGTPRLMAELIYGGGLRVTECCKLRVKDIDFANNLIFVRQGKGAKDRSTLLPCAPSLMAVWRRSAISN